MISPRSRTLASIAAGALLLAPLASCGDSKSAATKPAATSTSSAGSAIDKDAFFRDMTAAMALKSSVHLNLDGGQTVKVEGDIAMGSSPAMRLTATIGGGVQHLVVADNQLFIQQSPGGKYVKIGKDDPTFGSVLSMISGFGPQSVVSSLSKGVTKVVEVGPKTIDGLALTQYAVTIDSSKVKGGITALTGAGGGGPTTMVFAVDADHLVHQIQIDLGGRPATITLSDWNKPVTITAPTAAQMLTQPKA